MDAPEYTRKTITDVPLVELDTAQTRQIVSKIPDKYLLIDMESGQIYRGATADECARRGLSWTKLFGIDIKPIYELVAAVTLR